MIRLKINANRINIVLEFCMLICSDVKEGAIGKCGDDNMDAVDTDNALCSTGKADNALIKSVVINNRKRPLFPNASPHYHDSLICIQFIYCAQTIGPKHARMVSQWLCDYRKSNLI